MAQVRCRDASGSTGLFEDIHRTLENTGRSEGALAPRKKDADSVSTAACAVTTKTRARTAWSRRGTGRLWCVRATPRELSRGRRAARACASVPPRPRTRAPARRGEGGPSARAPCRRSGDDRRQGEAQKHPRAVRARRRADRSVLPPPPRAPRVAPRPYPSGAARARARKSLRPLDPTRSDPSTPSNRRRTAVEPPSRHLTSRLPRSSHAVRDDAGKTPGTADRRVAKADMLRRDMHWGSSDDELTPPARTDARDYYYDSAEDTPAARKPRTTTTAAPATAAATSPRRASTPATAARARSSVPSSPASGGGAGARLCDEGDLIFAGVGAGAIRDPVAAFERYLEAATRHAHVPAMARVARCYASARARRWISPSLGVVGARRRRRGRRRRQPPRRAKRGGRPDARRIRGRVGGRRAVRRAAELGSAEGARNHARAPSSDWAARRRIRARRRGTRRRPPRGRGRAVRAGRAAPVRRGGSERRAGLGGCVSLVFRAAARGSAAGLNALAMMHEDGSVPGARRIPRRPRRRRARGR